jgi:hypothetical protein
VTGGESNCVALDLTRAISIAAGRWSSSPLPWKATDDALTARCRVYNHQPADYDCPFCRLDEPGEVTVHRDHPGAA